MPEIVTENQLKETFWNNVISLPDGHRRLVAYADLSGDSDREGATPGMNIFVPQSPFDEFDLVLSLGTDGQHRVTVDWDNASGDDPHAAIAHYASIRPLGKRPPRAAIATPSTDHWAIWGTGSVSFPRLMEAHEKSNPGYWTMNHDKGYCALRPPWKNKWQIPFEDMIQHRFDRAPDKDMFAGLDWTSQEEEVPPPPEGVSLEELFAEGV
jgi:hypothetical protein